MTGSDEAIMTSMNPSAYRFPSGYAIHSMKKSRIESVLYDQYDPSQDPQGYRVNMNLILCALYIVQLQSYPLSYYK